MGKNTKRFMGWKDLVITPVVEVLIFGAAFACTWRLYQIFHFDFLAGIILFYICQMGVVLIVQKAIRVFFPLKEGIYFLSAGPREAYIYNLQGLLNSFNLSLFYANNLIPAILKKYFYQLLGANIGGGVVVISGRVYDPVHLVTIEESVIIGEEAFLLPHLLTIVDSDTLILGRITIKRGAIIGARSVLLPGVVVGENAIVNAFSLVPMNTHIGASETWGGNPARKIENATRAPVPASEPVRS